MIQCHLCEVQDVDLWEHLLVDHNVCPGEGMQTPPIRKAWSEVTKDIKRTPQLMGALCVKFHGVIAEVDHDVPLETCAPLPPNYRFPTTGHGAVAALRIVRYLSERRSTWIFGPPGTGKDAICCYVSHQLRMPFRFFQMSPTLRVEDWFWTLGFEDGSTKYSFGAMLKALVEGYVSPSGKRFPCMVVISDMDRATSPQIERLRTILDTDTQRVPLPDGTFREILPGTLVVVTANTMGGGDETGRMVSSRPIDGSIIDRFDCKVEMPSMEWTDEWAILTAKFPNLTKTLEKMGTREKFSFQETLSKVTSSLRTAIAKGEFFAEFSHRNLCSFMREVESLLRYYRNNNKEVHLPTVFQEAFQNYVDGLPSSMMRSQAFTYVTPHLPASKTVKR